MARIRTIKPDFFTSLTICSMPLRARLTFVGLWTHVDDAGRCVDDVRLIRAAIWPLDDWSLSDIEDDLKEIAGFGLVVRYETGERRYLAVCGFTEHQRINKPTPTKLPAPPSVDCSRSAPVGVPEDSATPPPPLPQDYARERKGKEGNWERSNPTPAGARDYVPDFNSTRGQTEEDLPAAVRSPLATVRCPEHAQPKIGNCVHCKREHGNARWYVDPEHWDERYRETTGSDFQRVKAWAQR